LISDIRPLFYFGLPIRPLHFSNPTGPRAAFFYVISLRIEQLPGIIKEDVEEYLETHPSSPAARLRPKMGMEGDLWLAFIGPELRKGATGLGSTPRDALEDFNRHFMEPLISRNGSEPS
jgi:hypothetical protein